MSNLDKSVPYKIKSDGLLIFFAINFKHYHFGVNVKYFITTILCLCAFNLNAQQEEIQQLLSMQPVDASMISDICNPDVPVNTPVPSESLAVKLSGEASSTISTEIASKKARVRIEAYSISIIILNGYTYHIADYFDGSKIITCLDGNLRGYQTIGLNGVLQTESTDVEWHHKYFVHYYPSGKVTTYQNRQVCEIY